MSEVLHFAVLLEMIHLKKDMTAPHHASTLYKMRQG